MTRILKDKFDYYCIMKQIIYHETLTIRITDMQRRTIEQLADEERLSLGEAARTLLDAGIEKVVKLVD
jgi:hypothetical protein